MNGGPWYKNPGWWILAILLLAHIYIVERKYERIEDRLNDLTQRAILRDH